MKKILKIIFLIAILVIAAVLGVYINNKYLNPENVVKVYFVKYSKGQARIVSVNREVTPENSKIKVAITELLKGPSEEEKKKGFLSEIPEETKLLGIKEDQKEVVVDLSEDFEYGGGSSSQMVRVEQLVKTAMNASKKPVYLNIEGRRAEVIGGEGIMIKQPLNKNSLK